MKSDDDNAPRSDLKRFSDAVLFEEVVSRLKATFRKRHTLDFMNGVFAFVIHRGKFQGIEENYKARLYFNSADLRLSNG